MFGNTFLGAMASTCASRAPAHFFYTASCREHFHAYDHWEHSCLPVGMHVTNWYGCCHFRDELSWLDTHMGYILNL